MKLSLIDPIVDMVSLLGVLWFFLPLCGLVLATNPQGVLYPFEISTLLTCHIESPLSGGDKFIPEETMNLNFNFPPVRQGDHPNRIFLPAESGFRMPRGTIDPAALIKFLGNDNDYNPDLTSTFLPSREAPRACERAASSEGSGGGSVVHISEDMDPTPFLNDPAGPIANITSIFNNRDNLLVSRVNVTRRILLNEINSFPELCEIHTALCPLATVWAELPNSYFPKFFAQGTCSNKNCSFPRSKLCNEDFKYTGFVTVLRWDCCFDSFADQIQWACGWRKVNVPLLCDCTCACTK